MGLGLRLESRCLGSHWPHGRGRERSDRGSSQGQETSSLDELQERREQKRRWEKAGHWKQRDPEAQCSRAAGPGGQTWLQAGSWSRQPQGSDPVTGGLLGGSPGAKATEPNDLDPPWMLRSTSKPLSALLTIQRLFRVPAPGFQRTPNDDRPGAVTHPGN